MENEDSLMLKADNTIFFLGCRKAVRYDKYGNNACGIQGAMW